MLVVVVVVVYISAPGFFDGDHHQHHHPGPVTFLPLPFSLPLSCFPLPLMLLCCACGSRNTQLKPRMNSPRAPDHWPQPARPACNMTCERKARCPWKTSTKSATLPGNEEESTWLGALYAGMRQECWQWTGRESVKKIKGLAVPAHWKFITRTLWHHCLSRHHKPCDITAHAANFEVNKRRPTSKGRIGNWNLTHQDGKNVMLRGSL